jgi:hypothetical protein
LPKEKTRRLPIRVTASSGSGILSTTHQHRPNQELQSCTRAFSKFWPIFVLLIPQPLNDPSARAPLRRVSDECDSRKNRKVIHCFDAALSPRLSRPVRLKYLVIHLMATSTSWKLRSLLRSSLYAMLLSTQNEKRLVPPRLEIERRNGKIESEVM